MVSANCNRFHKIYKQITNPSSIHHTQITDMGIEGLLQFMQPIIQPSHLSTLHHRTAAVDIMNWLYRAHYTCSSAIRDNSQPLAYLNYIQQMLDLFQLYQIKVICVFDGRFVGGKQGTVNRRRAMRQNNKKKAEQMLVNGNQQQSNKYLNRAITIHQSVIHNTIRFLKTQQTQLIVAPYQADSQIAKLYNLKSIDFAVCQDSDLIIYGVPVVLKLSTDGSCDYFDINQAHLQPIHNVFLRQLVMMSKQRRTEVGVLAGSDYLPSIKGIGIKTAVKFISQSTNIHQAISMIRSSERFRLVVPDGYEGQVLKAKLIFMLATSYNPKDNKLQFLDMDYLNEVVYDEFSVQDIKQIVGVDYGYDELVRQGYKNAWYLQPRQLLPLSIEKNTSLNISAVIQKEMTFSNKKLIKQNKQQQLQDTPLIQHQLIMMCEHRQMKAKSQQIAQIKQDWQSAHQTDQLTQKQSQKVDKFAEWMNYCPSN